MNITIDLPPDVERVLRRRAEAAGKDLSTFVGEVVAESVAVEEDSTPTQISIAEFERRLEAWTALHPVLDHAIDDSRESIYAGSGE